MTRFYIDIDNTLTFEDIPNGPPKPLMIQKVKNLIKQGHEIILWSTRGTGYTRRFAENNNIDAIACLGKPQVIVDDKAPEIANKKLKSRIITPQNFLDNY